MNEQNPFAGKPRAELERQRKLLDMAFAAEDAKRKVALACAFNFAFSEMQKAGDLTKSFEGVNQQSLPRPSLLGKPAGLSETEISNIKNAVIAGLEKAWKA